MKINKFQQARIKAGYRTQTEFAEAVGVKQAVIAQWEINACAPRTAIIRRVANALGVSIDEVLSYFGR